MSSKPILHIKAGSNAYQYYEGYSAVHEGDSGLNLRFIDDVLIPVNETILVDFEISCQMFENKSVSPSISRPSNTKSSVSFYLYPRSSIMKHELILANSVGIIDASYTGNIKAAIRNVGKIDKLLKRGESIVQICSRTLDPFDVKIVSELENTTRGSGGFGSTGR